LSFYFNQLEGDAMGSSPEQSLQTQERLIGDLRQVIENAEELLKNTDQYTSTIYRNARAKLALALQAATEELGRFEDAQLERMIEATRIASELFRDQTGEAKILRAFDDSSPK
jgi:ElaB/YqjD/DUF883 family membrane-anchored ribosome-binding protein